VDKPSLDGGTIDQNGIFTHEVEFDEGFRKLEAITKLTLDCLQRSASLMSLTLSVIGDSRISYHLGVTLFGFSSMLTRNLLLLLSAN